MDAAPKRQPIAKATRFEVFKRDSFRCQYCGATAPDVLLEVDHVKPVVDGGTDDFLNLITACESCNAGKGRRPLDENVAVSKVRRQLDELQARREQMQMMLEWMEELRDLKRLLVDGLSGYWESLAPGWDVGATDRQLLQRLSRRYSIDEICAAMNLAAEKHLVFAEDDAVTCHSWGVAFRRLPAICQRNKKKSARLR